MSGQRRLVLYMAHPLGGDVDANLKRALRWLAWLRRTRPEATIIAPWIAAVMSIGDDGTPEERAAGLLDDCTVVGRCDVLVLVGGRVSSGMAMERAAAIDHGIDELDLTHLGVEPPTHDGEAG